MTIVWHSGGRCTKNCVVTLASSGERSLVNLCSVLTLGAEVRRKLVISALDASVVQITVSGQPHKNTCLAAGSCLCPRRDILAPRSTPSACAGTVQQGPAHLAMGPDFGLTGLVSMLRVSRSVAVGAAALS